MRFGNFTKIYLVKEIKARTYNFCICIVAVLMRSNSWFKVVPAKVCMQLIYLKFTPPWKMN